MSVYIYMSYKGYIGITLYVNGVSRDLGILILKRALLLGSITGWPRSEK